MKKVLLVVACMFSIFIIMGVTVSNGKSENDTEVPVKNQAQSLHHLRHHNISSNSSSSASDTPRMSHPRKANRSLKVNINEH